MAGTRSDVKAFNVNQGDAAGAITITDGNGGSTLIAQSFPTGLHTLNIPDNGILAESGAYLSAFTGSSNKLTVFLS